MKKLLLGLNILTSFNAFANAGWTTYVTNNSDSELIFSGAKVGGAVYQNDSTWDLGDLKSTLIFPAHSNGSFYTEETAALYSDSSGTKCKELNFFAQNNVLITYQAIPKSATRSNVEFANVKVGGNINITTQGKYNFLTGCVSVKMSMSKDNILSIDSLDYDDHGGCK